MWYFILIESFICFYFFDICRIFVLVLIDDKIDFIVVIEFSYVCNFD